VVTRADSPVPAGPAASPESEHACAEAWAALGAAHARVSGQLRTALSRQCGLSLNEFEILLRLRHSAGGEARLRELQPAVPLTQPALSRAVARMIERGWLDRTAAPEDGRGVLVTATPAGEALLRAAAGVHAATIRAALLDRLTAAEQGLLAGVLRRVAAG
jgi:DNA-binding MarR family transcriptional regulator